VRRSNGGWLDVMLVAGFPAGNGQSRLTLPLWLDGERLKHG
jgi:hypothetical protein